MEADKLEEAALRAEGVKVKVEEHPSDALTPVAQDDADDVPEKKKKKSKKAYRRCRVPRSGSATWMSWRASPLMSAK